jgi:hypothetical protein
MLMTILALVVSASIDSTTLCIGDQTDMQLTATCEESEKVIFPTLEKELIPGVEIVGKSEVESKKLGDGRVQYNQSVTITSFTDSLFYINPLAFVTGEDTVLSNSLSLNVIQPFEVDSTDVAITDIKNVYRAPIWWWGILRWILLVIVLTGAAVGAYYLYLFIQKRRRVNTADDTIIEEVVLRPADEVALEKLDAISESMLWTRGEVKEYHTQLTDVVREYISRRFDVSSTEKTSDTTLREIRPLLVQYPDLYAQLHSMLTLADYVKFAKFIPSEIENEQSLRSAYHFVRTTAIKNEEDNAKA